MPATTELDSEPAPAPRSAPRDDPRRLVLADLVARLAGGVARQARDYEVAAGQARGPLRHALETLAHATHAQAADLAPLGRALGVGMPALAAPSPLVTPVSWGVVLAEAFQAERTLERLGRELAGLAPEPAMAVLATRFAAAASRNGEEVRRLYLRYS